jgi:hypothetical protein
LVSIVLSLQSRELWAIERFNYEGNFELQ